ncbi:probable disease resistance protein At4g27220 isoform X1 [Macadamia integrifolia]|uniref:probable disease resistance protein At4g27220 isoform X1 n=1 Tax=Macadamia integrifolia TaxID=60698 RepID=UPI001C4F4348|nr:probable disease resistance protein At4g27220 isoform X1 [Macadamia integrifolia]
MELRVLHINIVGSSDLSLLGNMKKLEILDLSSSKIRTLPQEIGGLTNLKSLRLSRVFFMIIPPKVLSRFSLLEELDLFYSFDKWVPEGSEDISKACLSEVASLASLKNLKLGISNIECLSSPISLCAENLTQFLVMIYATPRPNSYEMFYGTLNAISEGYYAAKMSFSEITLPNLSNWVKMLLERTEELDLFKCHGPKNIYPELSGGSGLNNLQSLKIQVCGDLEHILSAEAEGVPILAFSKLEELQLEDIGNLRKICHGRFLKGSLENLRILSIDRCSNLKHIFQMSMAEGLPQLEEIQILSCDGLEKIFMKNEAEDEEGKVLLPRLRVLELVSLPNFSMVCQGLLSVHDLPLFERLCIYECPNLKRLPLSLSPKSTPRLREIKVGKTWFNQLEWDEISNKLHIQEWVKVEFLNKSSIFNRTRPCRRTRRPRPR